MFGVITAAIVASIPIFTDYFFIGQDCTFHLMRIEGLKDGILSGQLPVRIQPTWFQNNGYAVSVLYGDLFLYFPAILRLIGISVQNSYKTYIFAINFITAIIAYYSFAKISKSKFIGMMASLVYTLSIYRFTDIYFRAAVGEYTAMAFFPLIIWGLYKIYTTETTKDNRIIWFPLAIGYTGVIQSHVLSCEMVAFFSLIVLLAFWKRTFNKNVLKNLMKVLIVVIAINLNFIVPFLDYMRENLKVKLFTSGNGIQSMGLPLAQLFAITPGGSARLNGFEMGMQKEMPMGLGITFIVILFLLIIGLIRRDKDDKLCMPFRFAIAISTLAILLSTDIFPYDFLIKFPVLKTLINTLQFPFRFMGIVTVTLTLVACYVVKYANIFYKSKVFWGLILVISGLALYQGLIMSGDILNTKEAVRIYSGEAAVMWDGGIGSAMYSPDYGVEYLPVETDVAAINKSFILGDESVIMHNYNINYNKITINLLNMLSERTFIEVPLIYYRGYEAVDIKTSGRLSVEMGNNGRIRVEIPPQYDGTFRIQFEEPAYWKGAMIISLISTFIIMFIFIKINKNKIISKLKIIL